MVKGCRHQRSGSRIMTMDVIPAKRGRPRKVPPAPLEVERKLVRVVHYKVFTSQGRFIAGQKADLPADEADDLIALGQAKPC